VSTPHAEPVGASPPDHDAAGLPDEDVVAAVLGGNTEAYGHLVRRYQEVMHRVAWTMVRDSDVAVDLVQDAFIRAYANLARCREPQHFRVWALTMVRNRCLDYLKERRRHDIPLAEAEVYAGHGADALEVLAARTELQHALGMLPDTLREAFLLRHVEELTYEEMAGILESTVAGVKMRVSRARDLLRRQLQRSAETGTGETGGRDVTAPHSGSSNG
jgi:RNA polymerase sigma factor (sigma-70 family)